MSIVSNTCNSIIIRQENLPILSLLISEPPPAHGEQHFNTIRHIPLPPHVPQISFLAHPLTHQASVLLPQTACLLAYAPINHHCRTIQPHDNGGLMLSHSTRLNSSPNSTLHNKRNKHFTDSFFGVFHALVW